MANYDFTSSLSPLDFELLSKDLLEAELDIRLENFSEGRDKGIDLRYAPLKETGRNVFNLALLGTPRKPPQLIVQCKRYSSFANLKSELKNKELVKIAKLNPARYILTTSASLSPQQVDDLAALLKPFVQSSGDIYGKDRLNSILTKHAEIERRHIKLWLTSAGVLDSLINAGTHVVSREEVERTIAAAQIYVRNSSFDESLDILKEHRVCIISGLPGIGKTTLARMLMLYFYDRNYEVVKIESDISEAHNAAYHNKPRFYYYDDFLGQTAQADKLNKNEDQKLLDFMASVRDSKDSVFVLTTREYILNQAKLHYEKLAREKFDHRTCIVDLAKYSRRIRAQILYNHLHFSHLPRPHLECLVAKRGYLRIVDHKNYNPRLIQYLTDLTWIGDTPSAKYLSLFLKNLDNPVEIWGHAFRSQISDASRHLLFVITTMPSESRIGDVEIAFEAFHTAQCMKFSIARAGTDFKRALKELDGTFVTSRRLQDTVLVRFQNPSIRDFMQNLLLGGESLEDTIASLVFFEQAQWLIETLNDEEPQVSRQELMRYESKILLALEKLVDTQSCSFSLDGPSTWQRVTLHGVNAAARLETIALAISKRGSLKDDPWMANQVLELVSKLGASKLSASSVVGPIRTLKKLGYLDSDAGKSLVIALKARAIKEPSDLDDYETLARIITIVRHSFTAEEIDTVREAYSQFAEEFAESRDIGNHPDELRKDALRIGEIGDLLRVDTDAVQSAIRDAADEIEKSEGSGWDDDDDRRGGGSADECSDIELDSMFGTLGD